MNQNPLGELVWQMDLREWQIKHLDVHNLSLFFNALEDAITEVLESYDIHTPFDDEEELP